jgi:hypothetical protein
MRKEKNRELEKKDKNRHLTTRVVFAMLFAIILVSVNVRAPVKAESLWGQIADAAYSQYLAGAHYLYGAEGEKPNDGTSVPYIEYETGNFSEVIMKEHPTIGWTAYDRQWGVWSWCRHPNPCEGVRHFDCGGLVYWAFKNCGVYVDRLTAAGYYSKCRPGIRKEQLQKGDLTFLWNNTEGSIYHVGIVYHFEKDHDSATTIVEAFNSTLGVICSRTLENWINTPNATVYYGDLLSALGGVTTSGGVASGVSVREFDTLRQDAFQLGADDLEVKLWEPEDNIDVNGWNITFSTFTNATSQRGDQPEPAHSKLQIHDGCLPPTSNPDNGMHAVDAKAYFNRSEVVKFNHTVTVSSVFYLTWWNVKHAEYTWTRQGEDPKKAVPCHGWSVDWPVPYKPSLRGPMSVDQWKHTLNIVNEDSNESFTVTGFTFNATMDYIEDLTTISFPSSQDDFSLAPGETWTYPIVSEGSLIGGHIYFKYAIEWNGVEVFESITDHEVTSRPSRPSVGGILVPIDKFGLLAPYIGLASTILVAAVATAIHVKRTRHIKKLTRVALLMLLAGTLSIVLSVTSVKASVSLTIDPQKASVGTSAVIWIWTGDGSIRIPKGNFTVTDPNGKVSTFNKDLEFSDTAVGITYPDDPNWSPAGSVNTVGTYTVKVKTYSLEKTFERTKNETSVGGIWFSVNKLTLLVPYIGFASTILIATAVTAVYVKSVKRRKEKQ